MAKKKKSKFKKFLKKAAPLLIAGLGAAALRKKPGSGFLKSGAAGGASLSGDRSALAKRLMTTDRAYTGGGYDDPIMTGGVGVKAPRQSVLASPRWDNWDANYMPAYKKGGRVRGTGKAKRGFGRAMKGKK